VRSLAAIMRQADAPPGARIQAIAILLDRGGARPRSSTLARTTCQGGHQNNHRGRAAYAIVPSSAPSGLSWRRGVVGVGRSSRAAIRI